MELQPLKIGNITAKYPIVQGGMGVGISMSSLAGAVAKEGGIGVISAAQPGFLEPDFDTDQLKANLRALTNHIKKAKEISNGGIIGVNIMRAIRFYDEYVDCCIKAGADIIISGAGLPVTLPELVKDTGVKCAPIVSSLKAAKVLLSRYDKHYHLMCDMVVIEGPKAGGHLGFRMDELSKEETFTEYDNVVKDIVAYVKTFEEKYNKKIPVIFAGGVWDRNDIDHYMGLGCDGVQMATRFVPTEECDAALEYKMAYINAHEEDVQLVKSPVGMPGRAIHNDFLDLRSKEREQVTKCFQCLEHCDIKTIPYCITGALARAAKGDVKNSLLFCGSNVVKCDRITTVKEIFDSIVH